MEQGNIIFRKARGCDASALRLLYNGIIEAMEASSSHAQWRKDGYPTDADLAAATAAGELYLAWCGDELAGAMVLNHAYNPGYNAVEWGVTCSPQQVLCIHTLGVSPRYRRQGVATAMVQYAIEVARSLACKSLRLDVIDTNPAADLFYLRQGFLLRSTRRLEYDSVRAAFNLYELVL